MAEDSSLDSWKLRRQESNRHDEFQRSLEELKDMMRTLLVMETGSSSIIRSVPIPPHRRPAPTIAPIQVPPNPPMRGVSQADMRFAEASSSVVRPSPIHPNRRQNWFQDQEIRIYGGGGVLDIPSDEMYLDLQDFVDSESPRQLEEVRRGADEEMEIKDSGSLNQNLQGISTSLTSMGGGHKQDSTLEIVLPVEDSTQETVPSSVPLVGDGLFLDAHNLLEEMPMRDRSAKLQEIGDFEPLTVTSLPLLEEIDGASSKVVSASLTEFVVEPHFVLLKDDGLPIIENREYRYA